MQQRKYSVYIADMGEMVEVENLEEALNFVGGYVAACEDNSDGMGTTEPGNLIIQRQ